MSDRHISSNQKTPVHQTPNERAKATMATMRAMLNRSSPLYLNEIRLPAEAAKNLLDEFDQAILERDSTLREFDRACQETREALARETTALRRLAAETKAPQPTDADDETPCPVREDGLHCECWYDGNACCGCQHEAILNGQAWPTCAEIRAQKTKGESA
jgi:hypothetical protein